MSFSSPLDTIFGLATAPGMAGIAVVRISGAQALVTAGRLVPALRRVPRERFALDRRLRLCRIVDPASGERLDRCLVVYLPRPGSYTAEDTVELHLHGGHAVTSSVLRALGGAGARPAEPGEFSLRAFLNGRIDLSEAEAVAALVEARSTQARRAALRQLHGGLAAAITPLKTVGIEVLAELEAELDFPEEDLGVFEPSQQSRRLAAIEEGISRLLDQAPAGRRLREGARVVIAGRPNVGKSSLLNALLGEERAIVHPSPGTTRDYLEGELLIGDLLVTLVDTAGQRAALGCVEALGVERAREQVSRADLVLHVIHLGEGITPEDEMLTREIGSLPWAAVLNQRDRALPRAEADARARLPRVLAVTQANTGAGVEELRKGIQNLLGFGVGPDEEIPLVTEARHEEALRQALDGVCAARRSRETGLPEEVVALELKRGLGALGRILGEGVGPQVLEAIFSRFCVGK